MSPLLYIIAGILLIITLFYFFQEKLIFKPEILKKDFQFKYLLPFKELYFEVKQGVSINALHFYRDEPQGLILYLHGNTRSIKGWARYAKDFYRYGYDVVLVDYRGFGKSTGKKSEKEMLSDIQFVYESLKQNYAEHHLIVYGRSLGSGFAAKIASDNHPRYLILDAPYYNFTSVVKRFLPLLPWGFILRYRLQTDKWIRHINCHCYIIHGTKDWLIPIINSERLQKISPSKITLIRIDGGGHNNLPSYDEYHNFLRDILKY